MTNVIDMLGHLESRMTSAQRWVYVIGAEIQFLGPGYCGPVSEMSEAEFSEAWASLELADDLAGDDLSAGVMVVRHAGGELHVILDREYRLACGADMPATRYDYCDCSGQCYDAVIFLDQARETA